MKELSSILFQMRKDRGAFNFETDEAKVILDASGTVLDIAFTRSRVLVSPLLNAFLIASELKL